MLTIHNSVYNFLAVISDIQMKTYMHIRFQMLGNVGCLFFLFLNLNWRMLRHLISWTWYFKFMNISKKWFLNTDIFIPCYSPCILKDIIIT